jgi:hypothetical protein
MAAAASTASLPHNNYNRELVYTAANDAGGINSPLLKQIVKTLIPEAADVPDDTMRVKEITGGITNALFMLRFGETAVRVRVFGGEGQDSPPPHSVPGTAAQFDRVATQ